MSDEKEIAAVEASDLRSHLRSQRTCNSTASRRYHIGTEIEDDDVDHASLCQAKVSKSCVNFADLGISS